MRTYRYELSCRALAIMLYFNTDPAWDTAEGMGLWRMQLQHTGHKNQTLVYEGLKFPLKVAPFPFLINQKNWFVINLKNNWPTILFDICRMVLLCGYRFAHFLFLSKSTVLTTKSELIYCFCFTDHSCVEFCDLSVAPFSSLPTEKSWSLIFLQENWLSTLLKLLIHIRTVSPFHTTAWNVGWALHTGRNFYAKF